MDYDSQQLIDMIIESIYRTPTAVCDNIWDEPEQLLKKGEFLIGKWLRLLFWLVNKILFDNCWDQTVDMPLS